MYNPVFATYRTLDGGDGHHEPSQRRTPNRPGKAGRAATQHADRATSGQRQDRGTDRRTEEAQLSLLANLQKALGLCAKPTPDPEELTKTKEQVRKAVDQHLVESSFGNKVVLEHIEGQLHTIQMVKELDRLLRGAQVKDEEATKE
jgi:hypothetical protein